MAPRFGTDGVRGVANIELTTDVALALGRAAARVLGADRFVVGRDTRRSGPMLEAALVAGLCAEGATVELLGVVPTPAVAWTAAAQSAAGAMISASHNPFADNGIKLFAAGGVKLADAVEADIEAVYTGLLVGDANAAVELPHGAAVGTVIGGGDSSVDGWVQSVCGSIDGRTLSELTVVLDCAHGAATGHATRVFKHLGATVHVIGDEPDGVNINDGVGSTSPSSLQRAVIEHRAELGLAFDGDADRLIAVDNGGTVVDGDRVLALLATDRAARGHLAGNTVVVTVMSNLGFHQAMAAAGIEVLSTAVGDRYVLQALDENGFVLGGEQSGHVICRDLASTGDGVLTGVQLADVVARAQRPLADLAAESMTTVPQVLMNVRLPQRDATLADRLRPEVVEVEEQMGNDGRVLVRASGTEPLLRIMVEHLDADEAERACSRLVAAAERLIA
ncbi:MAG: phosphoglucosamine mutase [Actinomycetota bacterium]